MNTNCIGRKSGSRGAGGGSFRARQRGVSLLIILALLACMAIIVAADATALAMLKHEILRIDGKQRQRYGQGPGH